MSAVMEVIDGLQRTGTGESKLEVMRDFVQHNPSVEADKFINWVREEISPVTADKARHIASGQPIEEILGKPPAASEEKKAMDVVSAVKGLVEALAEKKEIEQNRANDLGLGVPRRPSRKEE